MKIYVASSWRNPYYADIIEFLRSNNHLVYDFRNPDGSPSGFQWSNISPKWQEWTTKQFGEALNHPEAELAFKNDFDAMQWADVCLLVLPCGRSAHSEAGWMKGAGKKVYVYSPETQEPELMYKLYDGILATNGLSLGYVFQPDYHIGCQCLDVEVGSYDNQVELLAPKFMLPLTDILGKPKPQITICVDRCLADEIQYLWSQNIYTLGCCCGHNKNFPPYIQVTRDCADQMERLHYVKQESTIGNCFWPKTISSFNMQKL